ncbi:MAG: hypothetical protein V1645_04405 [archaeon]
MKKKDEIVVDAQVVGTAVQAISKCTCCATPFDLKISAAAPQFALCPATKKIYQLQEGAFALTSYELKSNPDRIVDPKSGKTIYPEEPSSDEILSGLRDEGEKPGDKKPETGERVNLGDADFY